MKRAVLAVIFLAALLARPMAVSAQSSSRLEVDAGLTWTGSVSFAEVDAVEKTPTGGTRVVFKSTSSLDAGAGLGMRLGFDLTPAIVADVGTSITNRNLTTTITGDVENASGAPQEQVRQYVFEAGVRYRFHPSTSTRLTPFVTAGVGYLRDVHEGNTLIETGHLYYVGGGASYLLRDTPRASIKNLGLRGDVRAQIMNGGVSLDGATHTTPAIGIGLFLRF
ncbi:MAG: outer membrane beta-barrel protein [Acidobacteriaceae bacterium]|nr:outer membrane beta-barrel protein [Acidobacteriaceae bacterium]